MLKYFNVVLNIVVLKVVVLSVTLSSLAEAQTLKPFTSDGCSAFPDGTKEQKTLWLACCVAHDRAYWRGGSYKQRADADKDLRVCVEKVGKPQVALLMLAGVRVGGSPFFPTTFRWGYGWPYPRFYGELTPQEQVLIEQSIASEQPQPAVLILK